MRKLSTILFRCWRFFVDDGSLATALVLWPLFVAIAAWMATIAPAWCGPILAVGFVLILIENVIRTVSRTAR